MWSTFLALKLRVRQKRSPWVKMKERTTVNQVTKAEKGKEHF